MAKKPKSYDDMNFEKLRHELTHHASMLSNIVDILAALPPDKIKERILPVVETYGQFISRFAAPALLRGEKAEA